MFGVDDAIIGSIGSAALGGIGSFIGGQQTNAANAKQAVAQDIYNSQMYNIQTTDARANTAQAQQFSREILDEQNRFNASQADINRQFQTGTQREAEQFNNAQRIYSQDFNNQQRILQNQWNLDTASTAYQRSMADMKKAGLNPILAAGTTPTAVQSVSPGYSSPASVGSQPGSTASSGSGAGGSTAQLGHASPAASYTAQNVLGPAIQSALSASKIVNETSNLAQQTKNLSTTQDQTIANTNLLNEQLNTQKQLTEKAQNDAAVSAATVDAVQAQTQASISNAKQAAEQAKKTHEETTIIHDVGGGNPANLGTWDKALQRLRELLGNPSSSGVNQPSNARMYPEIQMGTGVQARPN